MGNETKKTEPAERATELEWLKWFVAHADFGPAEDEMRDALKQQFMAETGKKLPKGWNYDSSGEEI